MRTVEPLRPGDPRQLGAYVVAGRIGKGGQGEVYLVLGEGGERLAAKVLNTESWSDARAQRSFMREVALAKQVARFCTAQVVDAGMVDGQPYLISEFIDGPSLAEKVYTGGPLSGGALERLAIGTATALTAIHQAGIVHRDFKPGNVLIGPDGPRVIDFGIAREAAATATSTSQIMGTPAFIAPEQLTGQAASAASDVFAWGVTIAYAATGTAPFGQDSIPAVINRVLNETPDLSDLPFPLRDLVGRCLDKSPEKRPSAQELLLTLLGGKTQDMPAYTPFAPSGGRLLRRSLAIAAVALVVGAGGGAAAAVNPWDGGQRLTAATTTPSPSASRPATATTSPTPTAPSVTGLTRQDALAKLRTAGMAPGKVTLDCAKGAVPDQVIRAEPRGQAMDLVIGAARARVPDARGWPLKAGKAALEKAGFTVTVGYRQGRDWIGKVAALRPAAGTMACKGSQAQIWIGVK
ncbi:serine/threonine protein kinase [Nonomuraea sp. NPDC050556]|uniref:serine/threonine protein kinase n=1 Tax=Nonomuraea sp. NPDC050556 TaxID=3364369 RepID=UPI0037A8BD43